jgi:hypothetical protein
VKSSFNHRRPSDLDEQYGYAGDGTLPTLGAVPTPVGPRSPDPDDPDLWDWGGDEDEDEDDFRPRWQPWRLLVVGIVVVGLVLLLLASVL